MYTHTARSLVMLVAIEAERAEHALEFAAEEGGGLAASGVAGALGAEEDAVGVWVGADWVRWWGDS